MNVILTPAVDIALNTLGQEERASVAAWLDHLKNWETDDFIRRRSHKLSPDDDVYVLNTTTDLRLFFKLEHDRIVVLDIATKATIQAFGSAAGQGRR